jgi:hypothetical protein
VLASNKNKMKILKLPVALCCIGLLVIGCNSNTATEKGSSEASAKDKVANMKETTIDNAGEAKAPKGKLSFTMDGQPFEAKDYTVQCMFVGMGMDNYAQGIISGNSGSISVSGVMMTKPEVGEIKNKGSVATSGISITKYGVMYNGSVGDGLTINITKVIPDGNNHYIAGNFSGTFKTKEGKTVAVSDGVFESAYAQ